MYSYKRSEERLDTLNSGARRRVVAKFDQSRVFYRADVVRADLNRANVDFPAYKVAVFEHVGSSGYLTILRV